MSGEQADAGAGGFEIAALLAHCACLIAAAKSSLPPLIAEALIRRLRDEKTLGLRAAKAKRPALRKQLTTMQKTAKIHNANHSMAEHSARCSPFQNESYGSIAEVAVTAS